MLAGRRKQPSSFSSVDDAFEMECPLYVLQSATLSYELGDEKLLGHYQPPFSASHTARPYM